MTNQRIDTVYSVQGYLMFKLHAKTMALVTLFCESNDIRSLLRQILDRSLSRTGSKLDEKKPSGRIHTHRFRLVDMLVHLTLPKISSDLPGDDDRAWVHAV